MDFQRHFLRLGPSRQWYAIAAVLWVGGFLSLFLYGYQSQTSRDSDAAGFQRGALDQTVTVRAEAGGRYGIWLESAVGTEQTPAVRRLLDEAQFRQVRLRVIGGDGRVVQVLPLHGYEHRADTGAGQVRGLAVGELVLAPGEYQVTLAEPAKFAGDAGKGAGLAVGAVPADADVRVPVVTLIAAVTGAGLGVLTVIRRQRAT